MGGIFSIDSKLMHYLGLFADMIIVNILFLICCIPIITIGPALSGLYASMRQLANKEDDNSNVKAFFKGFVNGFSQICVANLIMMVIEGILAYTILMCLYYADTGVFMHWLYPTIIAVPVLILHSLIPVFHSQFSCTFSQLFRNVWILMLTHPLHALISAILFWIPPVLFLFAPALFIRATMILLTLYFSLSAYAIVLLFRKSFKKLIDNFYSESEE